MSQTSVDAPPGEASPSDRDLAMPAIAEPRPAWSRPALIAVMLLAAALMLIDVTRSGYGNGYYAAGALAASHSWNALFNNAADLGGYVSLDKGPLPDWLQGLSGRLFGFGSFSVMVPGALYAIATVLVLHDAVRRALGDRIAILAALIMALTPVAVLVGRYNTPDSLLLLLLVCAAWSLTVAVQAARMRELLICAVLVGLAFNTKMLEAYLVLPALAAFYLLSGNRSLRRRLVELALAGGITLLVSLLWCAGMMLVPASDRPYVGDSTNNSWFQLILEGNGVQRVTGNAGAFARHLGTNALYLASPHVAGQIAWLLPLALLGAVLGLLTTWRSRRRSLAFGTYAMWSIWALVGCVVFSFSAGTRHAYYTSLLAPPIATLAASALVTLWRSARASLTARIGLAAVLLGTSVIAFLVLEDAPRFVPWLRWLVFAAGVATGVAALALRFDGAFRRPRTATLALGAAAVALLGGPAAYSLATVTRDHTGYDPIAGPELTRRPVAAAPAGARGRASEAILTSLSRYLQANRGHARFLLAATGAGLADSIMLATRASVITLGGFSGSDPAPSAGQIERLIEAGALRYVLLDVIPGAPPAPPSQRAASAPAWVHQHCSRVALTSVIPSLGEGSVGSASWIASLSLFRCEPAT